MESAGSVPLTPPRPAVRTAMKKTLSKLPGENRLEAYRPEIERCVKCGTCTAVCPSFLLDRRESMSARGRMALIQAVLDGGLTVSPIYRDRLASCTGCLACEASCPSGVPVTEIIQAAKEQAAAETGHGLIPAVIAEVFRHPAAFRTTAWMVPYMLHYPRLQGAGSRKRIVRRTAGANRGRIAFFPGCAAGYLQPEIGTAAVRVLEAWGYDVIVPRGLQCCGRPLLSLGSTAAAAEQAKRNSVLFAAVKADAIVTACASCGLTFKREYPTLLSGKKAPVVFDIHEFLAAESSRLPLLPVPVRVTWHDPCHLGRGQGLSAQPRDILRAIPGIELVEMRNADRCCGFGGVMRLSHRRLSDGIAAEKARTVIATKASAVVTGCPACRMQIGNALRLAGSEIRALHTVQILEQALGIADLGIRNAECEVLQMA